MYGKGENGYGYRRVAVATHKSHLLQCCNKWLDKITDYAVIRFLICRAFFCTSLMMRS